MTKTNKVIMQVVLELPCTYKSPCILSFFIKMAVSGGYHRVSDAVDFWSLWVAKHAFCQASQSFHCRNPRTICCENLYFVNAKAFFLSNLQTWSKTHGPRRGVIKKTGTRAKWLLRIIQDYFICNLNLTLIY